MARQKYAKGISRLGKVFSIDPVGYIRDNVLAALGFYDWVDFDNQGDITINLNDFEFQENVAIILGAVAETTEVTPDEKRAEVLKSLGLDPNKKEEVIESYPIKVTRITSTGFVVSANGKLIEISVKEL